MKKSFSSTGFIAASVLASLAGCSHEEPVKPNIIFFLVDDMGWQDTSVPFWKEATPLNQRYHTPNMELLASQGMKFTQAYACPLSSPARISLMTGMNAARHGVTNWTLRKNVSPDNNHKYLEVPAWNMNGLSPVKGVERTYVARTLPMFLKESGYQTIHIGKAHWGAKGTPGQDPLRLGFDTNIAGHAAGGPGSYYGKYNFSAAWRKGDLIWNVPGLDKYKGTDINLTEALTLEAVEAMRIAVTKKNPFYMYMSHYAVHAPFEKDKRFFDRYKAEGLTDSEATYASMIEGMDKSLGDILNELNHLGIADSTIIIFMSDNGSPSQNPQNEPLRGHKISPYEGGIRVPMIVKWPGVVAPGSECNVPLIIEDLFPTILDMAHSDDYKKSEQEPDGRSLLPLLQGKKVSDRERTFIWHFPHNYEYEPYSVIRKGDWKLIHWYADGREELYNIPSDIGENKELSAEYNEVRLELASELGEYLKTAGAKTPYNRTSDRLCAYPGDESGRK